MRPAVTVSSTRSPDVASRRLAVGLLLSVLLHALVLSVRFGIPGLQAGSPAPITITLARAPQPVAPPEPAVPAAAAPMPVPPPSAGVPAHGLRLVDPVAPAKPEPAPMPAKRQRSPARRLGSTSPRRPSERLKERVIAQEHNPEAAFAVPLPEPEKALATTPDRMAVQDGSDTGSGQASAKVEEAAPDQRKQEQLQAQERAAAETEAQRQADEQARRSLALQEEQARRQAEEQARVQALQQVADEQAKRLAQQRIVEEQARLLALQLDEQLRQERQAALEVAARKQAEEESRQATLRQRALDELAARQQAERLALKRQAEEAASREAAELAARLQAEQLAQQRAAEQLAQRRKAEELAQQQAREEARQQAEQAARRAAELAAIEQRGRADERGAGNPPFAAPTDGIGAGGGRGALPRGALASDLANRARELVRGIDLPGGVPAAARPAQEEQLARRRAVSWGLDRDVPLRLYIDSFRQKIERNGMLGGARFDAGRVRTDPLVSVAIRSDGSVEDVTIVRSSGRPDTDEAVRHIIRLNARYAAFPPNVAARFDVIEIRRIWAFAEGLKLLEEVR